MQGRGNGEHARRPKGDQGVAASVDQKVYFPRDPKDAKLIECAIATEADFLITGDQDFEEIQEIGNTLIISVSLFKTLFIDNEELFLT